MQAVDTPKADLVNRPLVKAYFAAGLTYLGLSLIAGFLFSLQFLRQYPFPGAELLSPGRIRMIHTNVVAYGFILNCMIGGMYWALPRLTAVKTYSSRLSWAVFWMLQAIALGTFFGILFGFAQGIEWGETPIFVDPFVAIAWVLLCVDVVPSLVKSKEGNLYVTLWYISAALVWTALTYLMGNYLPQFFVSGSGGAAITGMFIHDLVGLFVTPFGWGLMYYFVPIIAKRPIWSHTLSLVGFWGLAFFYPLNGVHHFLWTPIPMNVQYGAVIATIAVEIVVTTVVVNFFMTLRGRGDLLRTSLPIRWFYTGMVFYFLTCLQCAFQVTLTFQKIIHFTDWVVGHAHLVMFGVFGFWIQGMVIYLWPRLVEREWWSRRLLGLHYWFTLAGMLVMFFDLVAAGLMQGFMWRAVAPWEEVTLASVPFWLVRTISGVLILVGVGCMFINVVATWSEAKKRRTVALAASS